MTDLQAAGRALAAGDLLGLLRNGARSNQEGRQTIAGGERKRTPEKLGSQRALKGRKKSGLSPLQELFIPNRGSQKALAPGNSLGWSPR